MHMTNDLPCGNKIIIYQIEFRCVFSLINFIDVFLCNQSVLVRDLQANQELSCNDFLILQDYAHPFAVLRRELRKIGIFTCPFNLHLFPVYFTKNTI